jgi:hypothetical protein
MRNPPAVTRFECVNEYRSAAGEEQRLAGVLKAMRSRPFDPSIPEIERRHRAAVRRAADARRQPLASGWVDAI